MSGRSDKRKRKCTPRRARERERERQSEERERESERASFLLNCAELKASDTRHSNAINLMHDVIYLLPRIFIDTAMRTRAWPVPIKIKGRKLISRFKSCLEHNCQATSQIATK